MSEVRWQWVPQWVSVTYPVHVESVELNRTGEQLSRTTVSSLYLHLIIRLSGYKCSYISHDSA